MPQNKITHASSWDIYCSTVAWWTSSVITWAQAFISCCSSGGSLKLLPEYSTVDVSNTSSEPVHSKDRPTRDEPPPDENRRRRLEANVVSASPDLWRTFSPPLADRRRAVAAEVSPASADMWRRRCWPTCSRSRQTSTGQGACRRISSLTVPSTVRLSVLALPRVPITMNDAFSSNAIRHTTSPGLPGHERSRADTFHRNHAHTDIIALLTCFSQT